MITLLTGENRLFVDLRYIFNGGDLFVNFVTVTGNVEVDSLQCSYTTVANYTSIDVSAFNLDGGQYTMQIAEDVKTNVVYSEMLLVEREVATEITHTIPVTNEISHNQ